MAYSWVRASSGAVPRTILSRKKASSLAISWKSRIDRFAAFPATRCAHPRAPRGQRGEHLDLRRSQPAGAGVDRQMLADQPSLTAPRHHREHGEADEDGQLDYDVYLLEALQ